MFALNDHGLNSGADAIVDPNGKQPPKEIPQSNYEPLVGIIMFVMTSILATLGFQKYRADKQKKLNKQLEENKE